MPSRDETRLRMVVQRPCGRVDQRHRAGNRGRRPPARARRGGHRALVRAVARRSPPTDRRDGGRADRGAVRRARRHRPHGAGPRALLHDRHRPRDARRDRRAPAGSWDPRRADPRRDPAPPARHLRRPALGGLPAQPPADADVPRRPDPAARGRLRQPLPDGEGRRLALQRRGRGSVAAPRRAGGRRDRERAAVRVLDPLAPPARDAQRDRQRPGERGGARAAARARRPAHARARRCPAGADRAAGHEWCAACGRRRGGRGARRQRAAAQRGQGSPRARARPHGARRRGGRRPRGRSARRPGARRHVRDVPAAPRAWTAVRRCRRARQAGAGPALRGGRRAPGRVARVACGDRSRPVRARRSRRPPPGRRCAGVRARAART